MEQFLTILDSANRAVNNFVWGPPMLILLLGAGVYLTLRTRFFQLSRMGLWFKSTLFALFCNKEVRDGSDPGSISQFQSFTTALAGTMGTGNIVGVATALTAGGPGAIFWMWVSALFGMMTKYAEIVLGILFRRRGKNGQWKGGPMAYLEKGLHCKPLAVLFALFASLASFGIGNMTQGNGIADAIHRSFPVIPKWAVAAAVMALTALCILGGIKRIAKVTEGLIPLMTVLYLAGSLAILVLHFRLIPAALGLILRDAFSLQSVGGGVGGYAVLRAIRYGTARGVFSNEAGLGSSVIVHSAAQVKEPVIQGMWGIFEVFADTIVSCTLTALCILTTGVLSTGLTGAPLAMAAFSRVFGSWGELFITISITLFAFSTILGWSYYGEQTVEYLLGPRAIPGYKLLYILLAGVGCVASLELVWDISDTMNGLMALPNLIGILGLSGMVVRATKDFLSRRDKGQYRELARTYRDFIKKR